MRGPARECCLVLGLRGARKRFGKRAGCLAEAQLRSASGSILRESHGGPLGSARVSWRNFREAPARLRKSTQRAIYVLVRRTSEGVGWSSMVRRLVWAPGGASVAGGADPNLCDLQSQLSAGQGEGLHSCGSGSCAAVGVSRDGVSRPACRFSCAGGRAIVSGRWACVRGARRISRRGFASRLLLFRIFVGRVGCRFRRGMTFVSGGLFVTEVLRRRLCDTGIVICSL